MLRVFSPKVLSLASLLSALYLYMYSLSLAIRCIRVIPITIPRYFRVRLGFTYWSFELKVIDSLLRCPLKITASVLSGANINFGHVLIHALIIARHFLVFSQGTTLNLANKYPFI